MYLTWRLLPWKYTNVVYDMLLVVCMAMWRQYGFSAVTDKNIYVKTLVTGFYDPILVYKNHK